MNPRATAIALGGIVEAMAMFASYDAHAQPVFGLGSWQGAVEVAYERDRQELRSPGSPDLTTQLLRFDERLNIRNQGFFVLDPRLFTGNLGLTYGLFQEHNRFDGNERHENGRLTGYTFDAGILSEKPVSATIFANRNQDISSREFGGRSEITYQNHGATLRLREDSFLRNWGIPYFNASLGVREEHTQESTTLFAQRFQRDETRNIKTLDASKGFVNSDLGFRFEQTDVTDQARPGLDYQTQTANLTYSLDFGPTLNRRWFSRIYYLDRKDSSPVTFLTVDEQLRIYHHQDLNTDYRYLLQKHDTPFGTTSTQNASFLIHQRIYKNLTTDYKLQGQKQKLPAGERSNYAGQADFNYRRSFTPDRQVFVRLGGRYQMDNNDLAVSLINVVDESHTAPGVLGAGAGFTLDNPFVITSTIVVLDSGRVTATPGVDYDIVQVGNDTKIVPILGNLVIQPGENLFVSYSYEVAPNIRFSTSSWWMSGGIDFRWIALSLSHEQTDQTLRAGRDDRFLEDRRMDSVQSELRGDWGSIQGRAGAAYQSFDSTHLVYTRKQFNELLSYRARYDVLLSLTAEQSHTDYTLPERQTDSNLVRLSLDATTGGWYSSLFASRRTLDDSQLPREIVREAGLRTRRRYGKLDVSASLVSTRHERGEVETSDWRVLATAQRRF